VVLTVELAVPAMKSRRTLFFGVAYDSRNGKGYPCAWTQDCSRRACAVTVTKPPSNCNIVALSSVLGSRE
jgi:hypothetical protein